MAWALIAVRLRDVSVTKESVSVSAALRLVVVVGVQDAVSDEFASKTLVSLICQGYARWRARIVVTNESTGHNQLRRLMQELSHGAPPAQGGWRFS